MAEAASTTEFKMTESGASGDNTGPNAAKASNITNLIILGMAGAGKTTFVSRLTTHLNEKGYPPYVINLDPACSQIPYTCNIDIRDIIKYNEVRKTYGLGPNGAIVTSLGLFATKFEQVINLLRQKEANKSHKYVIFDTPGQIEIFNWSASGSIITGLLASEFTTIIVYVIDTVRTADPTTFMHNMLYACSMMCKYKLPFIVVMNKTDVKDCEFAKQWMNDFTVFDEVVGNQSGYVANLNRSMSLVLDEFYKDLSCVGVSSTTGSGFDLFLNAVKEKEVEFDDYRVDYAKKKMEYEKGVVDEQNKELERVKKDVGSGDEVVMQPSVSGVSFDLSAIVLNDDEEDDNEGMEVENEETDDEFKKCVFRGIKM